MNNKTGTLRHSIGFLAGRLQEMQEVSAKQE